jgi:hypothetical protein
MTATTTADRLLNLEGVARRVDAFVFELVDQQYNHIGDLNVGKANAPTINMDTSRTIFWTVSNVSLYDVNVGDINPLTDRVRAYMVLQDGSLFPCGIYTFGTVPKQRRSFGDVWAPELFDEVFFIDQDLDHTVSVGAGGSILDGYVNLMNEIGLPLFSTGNVVDQVASSSLVFPVGTSRYKALASMAALLGSFPPHMRADGTFTLQMPPQVGDTAVAHTYGPGTHVQRDKSVLKNELYKLPNRWIAYSDSPDVPIVGFYDLPDAAPTSYVNRGKHVTQSVSASGIATVTDAQNRARLAALQDATIYETATYSTTADPRHGVFDTVSLYETRYLEVGWSLVCKSGEPMSHSLIRLYD